MSSSTNRTRTLTTLGILTAIILVMTFTPLGYIKTMGLEITLLHIPVILGAALTGPAGGMVLGAVFGFTSFFQCFGLSTFGTTLFSINPAGTFIVCVIPRILLGLVAASITSPASGAAPSPVHWPPSAIRQCSWARWRSSSTPVTIFRALPL